MRQEIRTVVYDEDLGIEAYRFEGFVRPFPSHFHEYYVIGYVESGQRTLSCKNAEYNIRPGHILVFNPGDSHAPFFGLSPNRKVSRPTAIWRTSA